MCGWVTPDGWMEALQWTPDGWMGVWNVCSEGWMEVKKSSNPGLMGCLREGSARGQSSPHGLSRSVLFQEGSKDSSHHGNVSGGMVCESFLGF